MGRLERWQNACAWLLCAMAVALVGCRPRQAVAATCVGMLLLTRVAAQPPGSAGGQEFDAEAAWAEFDDLVRNGYGYFERPGVDGGAILGHFRSAAKAAGSRVEFVAVLKLIARNFADPHFLVGPLTHEDPAVIPTASDLYGQRVNQRYLIVDVRSGGDALTKGIRAGDEVIEVDGAPVVSRIESLLDRYVTELSAAQVDHGLNLALAGMREQPRSMTVMRDGALLAFSLAPTDEQAHQVAALPLLSIERVGDIGLVRFNNSLGRNETIAAFREALIQLADTAALIIDLRNTPSGGNTLVARGILGHFVDREAPYQVHVVPAEQRRWGVPRKFVEYVLPVAPRYTRPVVVIGGRWTGSMGEGLMIGFDAVGLHTVGSPLAHLLGALFNMNLPASGARVDLALEQLYQVNGQPRETFVPRESVSPAESGAGPQGSDAALAAALRHLRSPR